MGVIKRGILGGFSNKVANVIGSSWKGIAYMRAMPLSVANPRTVGQVSQRTKFGTISSFASNIVGPWIQPLWNRFAVQASGFNDFVKRNIEFVSTGGVIDYDALVMSRGKLFGLSSANDSGGGAPSDNFIDMTFDDDTGTGNALATDRVYCIGYNVNTDEWSTAVDVARSAGNVTVVWQTEFNSSDVLKIYLAARRLDGTMVSDSYNYSFVVT